MTYKETLRHPLWQKKRLKILERDNFRCLVCHSETKTLEVHHLFYIEGAGAYDYPDDWLVTLCHDCHDIQRKRNELEKHFANTLLTKGFLVIDLLAFSCLLETDEEFTKTLIKTLREFQNG